MIDSKLRLELLSELDTDFHRYHTQEKSYLLGVFLKKGLSTILQPLVDVIIAVEHSFLVTRNLAPGTYAIVDRAIQDALIAATTAPKTIVSGGSAANSIACAHILGVPCSYIGLVGDDEYGKLFQDDFTKLGIDSPHPRVPSARTGVCLSLVTPDGERTMRTDLAIATELNDTHIDEDSIDASSWLLLEGHLLTAGEKNIRALLRGIEVANQKKTKIALNINSEFAASTKRDRVLAELLPKIDLIIGNEPEAMALTQTKTRLDAFSALAPLCPTVIVTCGRDGALIKHEKRELTISAYTHNVKAIDSTGAGDVFTGVLLAGLSLGCPIEAAARGAARLSATVIAQPGARLQADAAALWHKAVR